MALPIGKLAILVGAGIVGSVLAKEGRLPNVSDVFSGAFKFSLKQIRQDDYSGSTLTSKNDSLLAQVNNLRQELQLLSSNRQVTIVTANGSGSSKYGVVIIVVIGYGYVWWKGWKLSDLMFATRHSLNDASSKISKQLETVYSSISAAKRHLSSRIDRVDCNLEECSELAASTKEEVGELRGEMKVFGVDVESVHHAVQTLETKISRIEGKQDLTNEGVKRLVNYAWNLENSRPMERIQATPSSSQSALKPLQIISSPRAPLPSAALSILHPPPSSNGSSKVQSPLKIGVSGLKDLHGIFVAVEAPSNSKVSNDLPNVSEERNNENSCLFRQNISGLNAIFSRTRSATLSFK